VKKSKTFEAISGPISARFSSSSREKENSRKSCSEAKILERVLAVFFPTPEIQIAVINTETETFFAVSIA
jgi:hypothetical protein